MRFILLILVCFRITNTYAQSFIFPANAKVAFVGNSITNNGEFHHNIFQYYVTRFPKVPIQFFNCGISGDVTGGILNRMDEDILIHKPSHVVLMIGMNDVKRSLYGALPITNIDTLSQRAIALEVYRANLDSIVSLFLSKNIKVILQKPTIYDQTAVLKTPNNNGVNDALKQCAEYTEKLAQKYNLPCVDYWRILNSINTTLQRKDSTVTIIGNDRVHPGAVGHLIMAYQFLKSMSHPQDVSRIVINVKSKKLSNTGYNCQVESLTKEGNKFIFQVIENALPFPIEDNQQQALDLVPFVQDLNNEELIVLGLEEGNYQLKTDDYIINTFSSQQLKKGINLALYKNTPQYKQSMAVREVLKEMWKNEANLRTIKWVEIGHLKECKNTENLQIVQSFLENRFETKYQKLSNGAYYKTQFEKYVILKPKEENITKSLQELRLNAYKIATPTVHSFTLVRTTNN